VNFINSDTNAMMLDVCDLSRSVILSLNEPSRYSQLLQNQKQTLAELYLFLWPTGTKVFFTR
jgi:hypothetical protein